MPPRVRRVAVAPAAKAVPEPGRRERRKLEKLDRIREAARGLFARQGFEATTTKQIAAAADIGSGTLFLYAPTKEDLLVLIFQEDVGRAVDAAFESVPAKPLLDQVMHVFDAITAHHAADPALARIFVKELPFVDDSRHGVAQFMSQMKVRLSKLIQQAKAKGEIEPDVPESLLAQSLFGTYFRHLTVWLGGRSSALERGDARVRDALDLQLRGLRTKHAAKRSKRR